MNDSKTIFSSRGAYKNQKAAVAWLEKVFGFTTTVLASLPDGTVVHAEMRFGSGIIHIGSEWQNIKSPASVGGANTQNISIHIATGVEEPCERARSAGAKIIQEPEDPFP